MLNYLLNLFLNVKANYMFLVGMHPACLVFCLLCITRFKFLGTLVFTFIRDTDYWFVVSAAGLHWPHEDWDMVPLAGTVMWDFFPHLLMSSHATSFFFSLLHYVFSLGPYYFWNVSPGLLWWQIVPAAVCLKHLYLSSLWKDCSGYTCLESRAHPHLHVSLWFLLLWFISLFLVKVCSYLCFLCLLEFELRVPIPPPQGILCWSFDPQESTVRWQHL